MGLLKTHILGSIAQHRSINEVVLDFSTHEFNLSRQRQLNLLLKETMPFHLVILRLLLSTISITTVLYSARAFQFPQELFNFTSSYVTIENPSISPVSSVSSAYSISPSQSHAPTLPPRTTSSPFPFPLAPALFVIGDSSVDSGTNNYLFTFARADRLPYGRDFDTHRPTGRFCNGRIPVDYLGK